MSNNSANPSIEIEKAPTVWQEECQTLTLCDPEFLKRIRKRGRKISFHTLRIAIDVRSYIDDHPEIPIEQVYYEVATYALDGRRPRTVRDWVEAIRGFSVTSLTLWHASRLTMSHFKAARKLYRDEKVEYPSLALDACINQSPDGIRPLTVDEMELLFNPAPPAPEQLWSFREWLMEVLKKKPPFGWDKKKIDQFETWKEEGKRFLE